MAAFGAIPAVLGIVFIAVGWLVGGHPHKHWVRTSGNGLGMSLGFGPRPAYRYRDQAGVEHDGYTWFSNWPVGTGAPVPVIFDPANPSRSRLDSFVQKGELFIVLGLVLLGMGIVVGALLAVLQSRGLL
ncbi:DUF3592 domain-containing protein [Streptomyces sp. ISL-90]|nr:DUF3592 domain-containing protein [Streptomyces sp. ISL-90]